MEVKQIFVSSENRDIQLYPYGNSYTLHITDPIKDVYKVELLYASIPNTQFNLTNGSNVIQFSNVLTNKTEPLTGLTTFSLPEGFYNSSTLSTEITQAIQSDTNIRVSYLAAEGKYLFFRSGNTFTMNIMTDQMAGLLGFNDILPRESTNVASTSDLNVPLYANHTRYNGYEFIKSDKVINLAPNQGVYLDIKELRTPFTEDAKAITGDSYSGMNVTGTFGLIPMDTNAGGIKIFKKSTDYDLSVEYVNPIRKLDRLTIEWINRDGKHVSFNGLEDNSFILRFYTLRKNI